MCFSQSLLLLLSFIPLWSRMYPTYLTTSMADQWLAEARETGVGPGQQGRPCHAPLSHCLYSICPCVWCLGSASVVQGRTFFALMPWGQDLIVGAPTAGCPLLQAPSTGRPRGTSS